MALQPNNYLPQARPRSLLCSDIITLNAFSANLPSVPLSDWRFAGRFSTPEDGPKPSPHLPNGHRPAVDLDPKPRIPFGTASHLAHENDVTSMPQFINPHRNLWAGGL